MSTHNKAPKTGTKGTKVTAGIVAVGLIVGGAAYKKGESDGHSAAAASFIKGRQELASKLLDHPKPLERLQFVASQTPESISKLEGLEGNALFENAAKVQASIFAISSALKISGQEVFEKLISSEAQEAYKKHDVDFAFVADDPSNPYCFNPFSVDGYTFVPLDASPDNPHPRSDPRTYVTAQPKSPGNLPANTGMVPHGEVREVRIVIPSDFQR